MDYPAEPWDLRGYVSARLVPSSALPPLPPQVRPVTVLGRVDSPASRAGGRELWGIPKEPAEFKIEHEPSFTGSGSDGSLLAEATVRQVTPGLQLPFPVTGVVMQTLNTALARTPVRAGGRISLAKGSWRVGGGLDWLRPYRPFATLAAQDFAMRFGPRR